MLMQASLSLYSRISAQRWANYCCFGRSCNAVIDMMIIIIAIFYVSYIFAFVHGFVARAYLI